MATEYLLRKTAKLILNLIRCNAGIKMIQMRGHSINIILQIYAPTSESSEESLK